MKRRIVIGTIIATVALIVILIVIKAGQKPAVQTVTVKRADVTAEVTVTGATKPVESVELSFERTGRVSKVYASVGDTVRPGQVLVELAKGDLIAQLQSAQAAVAQQQARLDELKAGTRPEQIAIDQVQVVNAETTLSDAKKSTLDALSDAYTKCDDALRNRTDAMFNDPHTANPSLAFTTTDAQAKTDLEIGKLADERMLKDWQVSLALASESSDLYFYSAAAKQNVSTAKAFLDKLAQALNTAVATGNTTQATIDGWKTDVSSARSSMNLAASGLSSAESGLRTADSALTLARNQLALAQAGSTSEQIAAQEAVVRQAQASVQSALSALDKTVLRSPIAGVITKQDAKLGQIVTVTTSAVANSSLISIISSNRLEIEANIPEVDIGRVAVENPVAITFDALPGETFNGKVVKIDPAETVVEGVVNYKVTVLFEDGDERVKSGLTANLAIKTASKTGVLTLPQYAIVEKDSGNFVRVPVADGFRDDAVTLGLRSSDGMVEVVSGVTEGETVVNVGYKTTQ